MLRSLLLFSAACITCLVVGLRLAHLPFDPRFGLLMAYFILVTAVLLRWQEASAGRTNIFIRRFMAGLTIKLMGSLILLAVLVKTAPAALTAPLVIAFTGCYIAFMGFSVIRLMKAMRAPKP